jgi:hypothetical protein
VRRFLIAILLVLSLSFPHVSSAAAPFPVVAGTVRRAPPVVFLACFGYVGSPRESCLMARNVSRGVLLNWINDPDGPTNPGSTTIEAATLPEAILELFVEPGRGRPSVRLVAQLPAAGLIHITSRARSWSDGWGYAVSDINGVKLIQLDAAGSIPGFGPSTIGGETVEVGTIGGLKVSADKSFSIYNRAAATGQWVFVML